MPSNPGRGTQNSESQRRGSTNATSSRTQGKNPTSTSSRNVSRSASPASTQRQSSTTKSRGSTGTTQTARPTSRPGQADETQARRTQSKPTTDSTSTNTTSTSDTSIANSTSAADTMSTAGRDEPTSTAQADREMPVQSSRETDDITQRDAGQRGAGQTMSRGQQSSPVFGGYGGTMGNPFVAIRRMMEDMDRLVSNFGFGGLITPSLLQDQFGFGNQRSAGTGLSTLWNPQVDINQRGENLVIRADLPGIKKEDVSVEIDRNVLTIRGERRNEFEDESEGFFRSERSYGSFQRSIPLPEGVTAESAEASFNNGVLEVRIPVPRGQAGSRRIDIR